jgi:hypothetical protein
VSTSQQFAARQLKLSVGPGTPLGCHPDDPRRIAAWSRFFSVVPAYIHSLSNIDAERIQNSIAIIAIGVRVPSAKPCGFRVLRQLRSGFVGIRFSGEDAMQLIRCGSSARLMASRQSALSRAASLRQRIRPRRLCRDTGCSAQRECRSAPSRATSASGGRY